MKLPEIKLPRLSRESSVPIKGVRAPKVLHDLYADLRDRRLLPLVALLLVAIAAAPFLLGGEGGSDEAPLPADSSVATTPTNRPGFTVVPASRTLRAYGDRLGYRKRRDPFMSGEAGSGENAGGGAQTESKGKSAEGTGTGEQAAEEHAPVVVVPPEGATTESTSPVVAPAESAVGTPAEVPAQTETPVEAAHGGSHEHVGSGEAGSNDEVSTSVTYVATGIDAKAGFLPHLSAKEKIAPMTKLPNPQNPVVVYVGESDDKKGALFLMSSGVTAFYGKGHCALAGQVCQLLELKPGQSATFAYGYGKSRYKLQLRGLVGLTRTEARQGADSSSSHKPAAQKAVGPHQRD